MSKYVIEIENDAFKQDGCHDMLFRAKGFRSLVFDQYGLDKLEPMPLKLYDRQSAYQTGLSDAWEAARKIGTYVQDGGIDSDTLEEIFGSGASAVIFKDYSAAEAIDRIRKYEEQKAADALADEGTLIDEFRGLIRDGFTVDQIQAALRKMQEGEDEM